MIGNTVAQYLFYFIALIVLGIPLGRYMAHVYEGEAVLAQRVLGPLERLIYRICGVRADEDMHWKRYAAAVILFQVVGFLVVYGLQRLQAHLPINPDEMAAVPPEVSFNTAVSFVTNTNWQVYGGESTLSYLTQMLGLTVQNFVSAATGMAVLVALIRGFTRRSSRGVGNFWVDMSRSTLYVLLPLAIVMSLLLVSQGGRSRVLAVASAFAASPLHTAETPRFAALRFS